MSSPDLIIKRPFLVIMPVWNRFEFTHLSLKCFFANAPFNLVESLIIFDNTSPDIPRSYIDSNFIPVVSGNFPNANYCLNAVKGLSFPDHVKYLVKIDNDIVIKPLFFQTLHSLFLDHPDIGTVFFAKNGEKSFNDKSSPHGGVFATRFDIFSWYGNFPVSGSYPGCEFYHRYVLNHGFKLCSIPDIADDLSYTRPDLVDIYVKKGWMRRPV